MPSTSVQSILLALLSMREAPLPCADASAETPPQWPPPATAARRSATHASAITESTNVPATAYQNL